MLKHLCGVGAAAVLLHFPIPVAAAQAPGEQTLAQRIDASIAPLYKAGQPGATVIVVKDGKTVFRKAYGMADLAKRVPLTPETSMRLGSVTKQFTAAGILLLADEGKLSLGDEITKFLPDFPTHGKKITIEHLLTHTAGVHNYTSKPDYFANITRDVTPARLIDSFKNDPLDFDPGTRWSYSNSGYVLLGAIIEKVSGMPYAKFLEQRIFVPLGMTNTAYEGYERRSNPHAVGYSPGDNGYAPAGPVSMTKPFAAGAIVSTVDDMARWESAIENGRLLKAATWQHAFTPYRLADGKATNYGYGWQIDTWRGMHKIAHGGSINGFTSYVLRLPAEHVYVAVLTNVFGDITTPDVPAAKAAAIAAGKPYPEFKPVTLAPALLDSFAGRYKGGPGGSRTVRHVGDSLVLQDAGNPRTPLVAFSQDGFYFPGGLEWYEFKRDAKGSLSIVTHTDGHDFVDERIGDIVERQVVKVPDAVFDTHAGRYRFDGGLVLDLSRSGGHYFAKANDRPALEIFPSSQNTFFCNDVDVELRFDDPAHPRQVVLVMGDQKMKGEKI